MVLQVLYITGLRVFLNSNVVIGKLFRFASLFICVLFFLVTGFGYFIKKNCPLLFMCVFCVVTLGYIGVVCGFNGIPWTSGQLVA